MIEPDFTRTHEIVDMLDEIYSEVRDGCKDRCYIQGSGAESVKYVLELARDFLAAYARLGIGIKEDHSVQYVLDMMREKMQKEGDNGTDNT